MRDLIIRELQAQDIPAVSRIVCAAFKGAAEREGVAHEEVEHYILERGSEVAIRAQFHEYSFFVACQGKQIVGMAAIKENEITKLYVDPSFQGQGAGRMLLARAEKAVEQSGHKELTAWVAFDWVIPFYEAMGMKKVGRKFDITGQVEGRNIMLVRKLLDHTT